MLPLSVKLALHTAWGIIITDVKPTLTSFKSLD